MTTSNDGEKASRGAFIVMEGCDRSGKSTQTSLLVNSLKSKGIQAEAAKFPNRETVIGKMINDYLSVSASSVDSHGKSVNGLNDRVIHLLFSANRWEQIEYIKKRLSQGVTVVCDRYIYSGIAYSAAKGIDMGWCESVDRGLPLPDITFFFEKKAKDSATYAARGGYGEERYENVEFQQKVYEKFLALKEDFSISSKTASSKWFDLDSTQSIEKIHDSIVQQVNEIFGSNVLNIDRVGSDNDISLNLEIF